MKIQYDPLADAIYIKTRVGNYLESEEIKKDIILDYGKEHQVLGIEILNASKQFKKHELKPAYLISILRKFPIWNGRNARFFAKTFKELNNLKTQLTLSSNSSSTIFK